MKRQRLVKHEDEDVIDLTAIPATSPQSLHSPTPGPAPRARIESFQLCPEQESAVTIMTSGVNTFLTGGAGSGKTAVLLTAVARLRDEGKRVRICAPTGMAAYGVGGNTIHSLLGLDKDTARGLLFSLLDKASHGPVQERLAVTDVLIIEEISMVENIFFGRVNRMFQEAKDSDDPFGGAQIIVCGDFRQLPPVMPFEYCFTCGGQTRRVFGRNKVASFTCSGCPRVEEESKQWAFFSEVWRDAGFVNINLKENHRQNEGNFVAALNKLGDGEPIRRAEKNLIYNHPCDSAGGILLAATNKEIKLVNDRNMQSLQTRQLEYLCLDNFDRRRRHDNLRDVGEPSRDGRTLRALAGHPYPTKLELKLGMRVLLGANIDVEAGLVNGSQGTLVELRPYNEADLPRPRGSNDVTAPVTDGAPEPAALEQVQLRGALYHIYRQELMKDYIMLKALEKIFRSFSSTMERRGSFIQTATSHN